MAKKYLDDIGLAHLWEKIKSFVIKENTKIPFGQVDSTSTDTVFTATIPEITELADGVCVYLRNGVVTSASGWTLNINGLGAKPVYSTLSASSRTTTIFNVNYTMLFVYNSSRVSGGCWDIFYGYDSNTNTIGYQLRTNSMSLPVSGATYRYRLLFTSADGTEFVPANTSTSTNATASRTVNQTPIDPFGEIAYYGYTSAISSGSRIGATYLWRQYAITLGYSFNRTGAALTLTSWKPVYIKCTPQSDGSAIMDADTPYVQSLPSTEDGKIYIYLGVAYSATQIELVYHHPVYYYKDGAIRLWTNSASGTETDPVFVASPAHGITSNDISNWNGKSDFSGSYNDLTNKPTIPSKTSDLTNDSGFITGYTESDPTVPAWAKASTKPSYNASEVGALATTGGNVTGDITLKSDAGTNSKSIIFQRGELNDNYNDWQIQDRGGFLYFDQRGQGSTAFANQVCFNTTGNVQATTFNNYSLAGACAKAVDTSISAGSTSTNLPTSQAVASLVGNIRELPAVTSSDNGKVLRVVSGAWSAESLPSASGVSF